MFDFDVQDVSSERAVFEKRDDEQGTSLPVGQLTLDVPITDIPRGPAVTLAPGTAVASALQAMRARHRSGVVVVQNHRPVGVVTDRDILGRLRAEVEDLRMVPLSAVMTPCLEPLTDADTVGSTLRAMCAHRLWHQPIVCSRGLVLGALDIIDISLWLRDQMTVMSVDALFAHNA